MEIRVETEGMGQDRAFEYYVERRLRFALEPHQARLVAVVAYLAQQSDSRYRVTLRVQVANQGPLLWIEEYAVDPPAALIRACDRLLHRLNRERIQRRRRRPRPHGGAPAMQPGA